MKKVICSLVIFATAACTTTKQAGTSTSAKGLYQVLTQQSTGGANIKFFEVLTEPAEIAMLKADPNLQGKISDGDLIKSNFIILNMGEKPTGGYSISVLEVREMPDKIMVKVKESDPEPGSMTTMAVTNPYAVVKINSKKKIEIE
jgi:hypothetical protein